MKKTYLFLLVLAAILLSAGAALYVVDGSQPAEEEIYCEVFGEGDETLMTCLVPKSFGRAS